MANGTEIRNKKIKRNKTQASASNQILYIIRDKKLLFEFGDEGEYEAFD